MANVSTDIRVFPAKEMLAADMAYVVDAAMLGSSVVHGCGVTYPDGVLTIADGRILIKGRLGYVAGGTIPLPADSGTYHLLAVCDLLAPTPFSVGLYSDSEKYALDDRVDDIADDAFNASNGVRYLELGTAVVDAVQGIVTSYTAADAGSVHDNRAQLAALTSRIDNTLGDHQSHLRWLDNRRWKANKLVRDTIRYPSLSIPANSRGRAVVNIAYGARYTATASGGAISVHEQAGTDSGFVPSTPDEYGRNTSLDQNHKVLAITGITITNADVGGGVNYSKCALAGFNRTSVATDAQHHTAYIDVINTASSAALIDIDVHVLYALNE